MKLFHFIATSIFALLVPTLDYATIPGQYSADSIIMSLFLFFTLDFNIYFLFCVQIIQLLFHRIENFNSKTALQTNVVSDMIFHLFPKNINLFGGHSYAISSVCLLMQLFVSP